MSNDKLNQTLFTVPDGEALFPELSGSWASPQVTSNKEAGSSSVSPRSPPTTLTQPQLNGSVNERVVRREDGSFHVLTSLRRGDNQREDYGNARLALEGQLGGQGAPLPLPTHVPGHRVSMFPGFLPSDALVSSRAASPGMAQPMPACPDPAWVVRFPGDGSARVYHRRPTENVYDEYLIPGADNRLLRFQLEYTPEVVQAVFAGAVNPGRLTEPFWRQPQSPPQAQPPPQAHPQRPPGPSMYTSEPLRDYGKAPVAPDPGPSAAPAQTPGKRKRAEVEEEEAEEEKQAPKECGPKEETSPRGGSSTLPTKKAKVKASPFSTGPLFIPGVTPGRGIAAAGSSSTAPGEQRSPVPGPAPAPVNVLTPVAGA